MIPLSLSDSCARIMASLFFGSQVILRLAEGAIFGGIPGYCSSSGKKISSRTWFFSDRLSPTLVT